MLAGLLVIPNAHAQESAAPAAIPQGTILPVRLNSSLYSSKAKPGEVVTAKIMQDVPLPNGEKIRAGSRVVGQVVDVSTDDPNAQRISLKFDQLIASGRAIPIRTVLRAVAGFETVVQAGIPTDGPVSSPIATTQIGGDAAYTSGGEVDSADGAVVGKSVNNGVLDQANANQAKGCRGMIDDNKAPQAMWVFSSNACGAYGLTDLRIAHTGRTEPLGVIVLASAKGELKLTSGAGMLLRIE